MTPHTPQSLQFYSVWLQFGILATTLHQQHTRSTLDYSVMHDLQPDPLWDEGLASYLLGEYEKTEAPLSSTDLQGFAVEKAQRVGDILETLFLMAIYGEWQYVDADGKEQPLDEESLNNLYAKGRITEADLESFGGYWKPS